MRALVTNDDGIASPGLRALAIAARDAGLAVTVVAPGWDSSGASASLAAVETDGRLIVEAQDLEGLEGTSAFGVEAAPAFIVRAAVNGAFGDAPDVVLSGVNIGQNTGHAVLHSGTVGAALTAATLGLRAAAFSIDASEDPHWETAAAVARPVLAWLLASPATPGSGVGDPPAVVNVNIPDVGLDRLQGLVPARLARAGVVQTNVAEVGEGYVKLEYSAPDEEHEDGTDAAVLARGYACFTAITAVCEANGVDTSGLARTSFAGPPSAPR